jgi:hypothetical protein
VEVPAAEAEPGLVGQWGAVPRALWRLREAAVAGDEAAADAALATIGAAVGRVNIEAFHPTTTAAWTEFSARLKNEVVLARRKSVADLGAIYGEIRYAVEQAAKHLGLPYQPIESKKSDADRVVGLREAVDAYLAVSGALAAYDEEAALAALPALAERIGEGGKALAAAEDMEAIREALEPVSETLIARVRAEGIDQLGNLYVVHCFMVKDYEGGNWLSAEPRVLNPYLPAEMDMLGCGVVKEQLSIEK